MSELKARPTAGQVENFLASIPDDAKRADATTICNMMTQITGYPATMWGTSMVGFGNYHYTYASGHSGDTFVVGFAPRKAALSIHLTCDLDAHTANLARLGKHTRGRGCLYVKRLSDIDLDVLATMIKDAATEVRKGQ
jgi:Domain of unknown function (DU1801)